MPHPVHTVVVPDGAMQGLANPGQLVIGVLKGIANVVGGGAGLAVTTAITGLKLPASYTVLVQPNQDATAFVTSKTATGFSVTLTPRLAANTLAAGTFDVVIVA